MTKQMRSIIVILLALVSYCHADIFTHRTTGEKIYGYPTQKTMDSKVRIYVQNEINFLGKIVNIADYDVTYNAKGRRDNIIVIPIDQKESLLSKAVADTLAKTITEASNRGPRYIILEIDSPGGRGDYMNIVCKAITDTTNCPVIAYITGEKFGGAYSVAAAIALACDKIYISPTASIGSAAPAHGALTAKAGFDEYAKTYTPANLVTYAAYVAKLAEANNRPNVIGAALMDRNVEVLEVAVNSNGKRNFINGIDKTPSQAIIKRWTQTTNEIGMSSNASQQGQTTNTLTLTSEDAVYCKMADKIANTQTELIADLGAEQARVIKSSTSISISRLFQKNQKTMNRLLTSIEQRESIAERIETYLSELNTQKNRIDIRLTSRQQNSNSYYDRNNRWNSRTSNSARSRRIERENNKNRMNEQYTQNDPTEVERYKATHELAGVLNELISDYRQVISISKRFPGTIPTNLSLNIIENKLTAARMYLRSL